DLAALGVAREIDLGVVSAVDCATLGPQVLLSLAVDEIAYGCNVYAGDVFVDNPTNMSVGDIADMIANGASILAVLDDSSVQAKYIQPGVNQGVVLDDNPVLVGPIDIGS